MPRRGTTRPEPEVSAPINDDRLRGFLDELDHAQQAVADEQEAVKDVCTVAKHAGVEIKAMKAALRLSKRSAVQQNDYLRCFEQCCRLLRVGAQTEMFEGDNVVSLPQ